MTRITTLKAKQAKADKLTIETVVRLESGLRRVSKHIYSKRNDKNELYVIPIILVKGKQPLKISYHGSGQIHGKLARGKLKQAAFKFGGGKTELLGIETLGKATPNSEILLWQEQGTPLNSVKGVVDLNRNPGVQSAINIAETAKNYPRYDTESKADYIFEIDIQPTPWIDIKHFLIEPGNVDMLEERVKTIADDWSTIKSNPNWPQPPKKFKYLEKAVIFTNLIPWFVIALFRLSDDAKGSESFPSGQPDNKG